MEKRNGENTELNTWIPRPHNFTRTENIDLILDVIMLDGEWWSSKFIDDYMQHLSVF